MRALLPALLWSLSMPALAADAAQRSQVQRLKAVKTAERAIIHLGTNDTFGIALGRWTMATAKAKFRCIADMIQIPIVWTGIHHSAGTVGGVTNEMRNPLIDELNAFIRDELCAPNPRCVFVPSNLDGPDGNGGSEYFADRVHLNWFGQMRWYPAIADGLAVLEAQP